MFCNKNCKGLDKNSFSLQIKQILTKWLVSSNLIPGWISKLVKNGDYLILDYRHFIKKIKYSAKRQKIKP